MKILIEVLSMNIECQDQLSWFRAKRVCISRGEKLLELATVEEAAAVPSSRQGEAWIGGENHAYVR